MQPNKKIKFARCAGWAANTWADSLRSDFSPHIRVPYLKVRCNTLEESYEVSNL